MLTLTTRVDGTLETQVVPGRYRIASAKTLNFEGNQYSWDVYLVVAPPEATVELSNDNARIVEGAPSSVDELTSVFKKYRDTLPRDTAPRPLWRSRN